MIHVLSIFGTRPEAIKMAPVVLELRDRPDEFRSEICVSAQHRQMLDQVLRDFGLRADHDLDLMTTGQTPVQVASRLLAVVPRLLERRRPDVVLVQGDTMTTFAAAWASFLTGVPVGHVEAGLRTGDRRRPFPEEANRVLATRVADLHFAPTARARDALLAERVPADAVFLTGNPVIDALLRTVRADYRFADPTLAALDPSRRLVLVTAHRRESFGRPIRSIFRAVARLAERFPAVDFVVPVHPNPEVRRAAEEELPGRGNLVPLEPLDYRELVHVLDRCHLVLTDSGGIQEEAPSLGTPVLVLREVTERPEGVEAGTAIVVGTEGRRVFDAAARLLTDDGAHDRMARAVNPYGDGKAAIRIADALRERIPPAPAERPDW